MPPEVSTASCPLHRAAAVVLVVLIMGAAALLGYGLKLERYVYVIPLAVLIALLAGASRLRHPQRAKIALLLTVVVSSGYFAEFVLAALLPFRPALAAWREGRAYDFRTYHRVVRDLRREGVETFPALMPRPFFTNWRQDWPLFPLGGISRVTTVYCNELGRYLVYESDEHGFHNPPGVWQREETKLAVVGDSFAHGACVDTADAFVTHIRKRYPDSLNLAMGANGPLTVFAGIKEYLTVLKPRVVLWFFYEGNDLFDLLRESASPVLMRYLREDFRQDLLNRQPEVDRVLEQFAEEELNLGRKFNPLSDVITHRFGSEKLLSMLRMAHLRGTIIQVFDDPWRQTEPPQLAQLDLFREVLNRTKQLVASWDGKFYFVFLPGWKLAVSEETKQEIIYRAVLDTVDSLNVRLIDLVPTFRAHPKPERLFVYPGSHYNPEGNRIVAEAVLTRLQAVSN